MIYFSYSHHDSELASRIVGGLQKKGIEVWFDRKDILTGDSIVSQMQKGINKCIFIAVLITQNSIRSGWVEREWQSALFEQIKGANKIILPLIAEDNCEIPIFLKGLYEADFRSDIERGLDMVMKTIKKYLDEEKSENLEQKRILTEDIEFENKTIKNTIQDQLKTKLIFQIFENNYFITKVKEDFVKLAKRVKADCIRAFFQIRPHLIVGLSEAEYNPLSLKPALLLSLNNGLVGLVISNGKAAYYPCDVNCNWSKLYCESDPKVVAELVVPIVVFNAPIGAVLVDWTESAFEGTNPWGKIINREEVETWCTRTAIQISHYIIHTGQDKNPIYFEFIKDCVRTTGSHRGYIALWTEHGSLKYTRYGIQIENFLELSPTEGVCGKCLRIGEPIKIDQLSLHPDAVISDPEMMSELVVPIKKGNITIGMINIEAHQKGNYNRDDLEYLEDMAKKLSSKFGNDLIDILTTSNFVLLSADNLDEIEILDRLKSYVSYILPEGYSVIIRAPNSNENSTPWRFSDESNLLIYPIKINGKFYKVLEINIISTSSILINHIHQDRIRLIIEIAANAIHRNWKLQRQNAYAEVLSDLTQFDKIKNPSSFLRDILKRIRYLLDCSHCTLFWVSTDDSSKLIPGISTQEELYLRDSISYAYERGIGLTGYVFESKKLICISDLSDNEYINQTFGPNIKWKGLINETKYLLEKARSFIACPIFSQKGGEVIGVLRAYIERSEIKSSFSVSDQHIIRSITALLSPLLENLLGKGLKPQVTLIYGPRVILNDVKLPPQLIGYTFSAQQAHDTKKANRLLSLRLETSLICNSRCIYCCNDSGRKKGEEISFEKKKEILEEALHLGAESIVFIGGGEFLCYDRYPELLKLVYELKMTPVIFTNGIKIDKQTAEFLKETNSTIIVKLDSLDRQIQDKMSGMDGAFDHIFLALDNLRYAGYRHNKEDKNLKIGASAVVTNWNIKGIPDFWRYCRENGIFPNLELLIPNGRARGREDLMPKKEDISDLKDKLLDIDRQLGYEWIPYTPRIGSGCLQLLYSLYITYDGYIRPCASLRYQTLNIRDVTLKEAISREPYRTARNIHSHLQGKCKECIYAYYCYGCRGLTYTEMKLRGASDFDALCAEDTSCHMRTQP
ncbi:MAG: GAF domain-containing protein [Candidatus Aminicenantes bacterium]|nr:GAF domain-containing protein [Candidatus Aminicenantes bacterium]